MLTARRVKSRYLGVPKSSPGLRNAWLNLHQGKTESKEPEKITTFLKQVDKKQDFVTSGENDICKWLVVADGHGKSIVIDCFRGIDWAYVVNLPTGQQMADYICAKVAELGNTSQSGATLTIVKIFQSHAEFYWAGDSTAKLYKNGKQVFQTEDHDLANAAEVARVKGMGVTHISCGRLTVKDPKNLLMGENAYFRFPNNFNFECYYDYINMTHAFGHNAASGNFFSEARYEFSETARWKIVVGSDGFHDMTCKTDIPFISNPSTTATNLGELALKRWNQKWDKMFEKDGSERQSFKNDYIGLGDDVCVAVWNEFVEVKQQLPTSSSSLRMSSCPF